MANAQNRRQPLSTTSAIRLAIKWVDRSGLVPFLNQHLVKRTGRPLTLSWRAVLYTYCAYLLANRTAEFVLADLDEWADSLTHGQRLHLLLPGKRQDYRTLQRALQRIGGLFDEHTGLCVNQRTGELMSTMTIDTFSNRLIQAALPDWLPTPRTVAIDGVDHETWARRQSQVKLADIDQDNIPADAKASQKTRREYVNNKYGLPRLGPDERLQHSLDPTAREGHRTVNNGVGSSGMYLGHEVHDAVLTRELDGPIVPHVALGAVLTPAGSNRAAGGLTLIDQLAVRPDMLLADRGYTYHRYENWGSKLHARGIRQQFDLHPKQRRVESGPVPGTLQIDGSFYSDALPEELRDLPTRNWRSTMEAKVALSKRYEERRPYEYRPFSHKANGKYRMRGPAWTGQVRCVNHPESMRGSLNRPTTNCRPGAKCGCDGTFTIDPNTWESRPDIAWRELQQPTYGTAEHAKSYFRRVAVESFHAELKTHRGRLGRSFTRIFGKNRNSIAIAILIGAVNIRIVRDGYAIHDPFAPLNGTMPDYIPSRKAAPKLDDVEVDEPPPEEQPLPLAA